MKMNLQFFGGRGGGSNPSGSRTSRINSEGEPVAPKSAWNTFEKRMSDIDYGYGDAVEMLHEFAKNAEDGWGDTDLAKELVGLAKRIKNRTASKKDLQEAWEQLNPY